MDGMLIGDQAISVWTLRGLLPGIISASNSASFRISDAKAGNQKQNMKRLSLEPDWNQIQKYGIIEDYITAVSLLFSWIQRGDLNSGPTDYEQFSGFLESTIWRI
jgi:hypothetical protein